MLSNLGASYFVTFFFFFAAFTSLEKLIDSTEDEILRDARSYCLTSDAGSFS